MTSHYSKDQGKRGKLGRSARQPVLPTVGEDPVKILSLLSALLFMVALPACTSTEQEKGAREWQRNECNRVVDREDREKCLKRVD